MKSRIKGLEVKRCRGARCKKSNLKNIDSRSSAMKKFFRKLALVAGMIGMLAPLFPAQALTVSPLYVDYHLNPGDTVLDVVKVYNEGKTPDTFHVQLVNFTHLNNDESGTPEFYPATEKRDGTGLATWITVTDPNKTYTLQPNERTNVSIAINVPKNAQPGAHYGAVVMASGDAHPKGSEVGVSSKLGSLIFITVSGEIDERGRIAEFGFKEKKLWYNYRPVDFFLRFENGGNTNVRPTGNVFIKNWYGRQVASLKVNEAFGSVLPKSVRRFEFGWSNGANSDKKDFLSELGKEWKNFAFGKYTATLFLNYGAKSQLLSEERVFYVWPWRLMLIALVLLLVVLFVLRNMAKSHDRTVIKRYERRRK